MIALKGTVWEIYTAPQIVSNTHAQVAGVQPHTNHVQHMKGQLSFTQFKSHLLALFCWLMPLTDAGGEETRVPRENPWWQASECQTLKPKNSSPNEDFNLHSGNGGRLGKQMC